MAGLLKELDNFMTISNICNYANEDHDNGNPTSYFAAYDKAPLGHRKVLLHWIIE